MSAKTSLRDLPDMNDIKIGPGGETFGQLKQRVLNCRATCMDDASDDNVARYRDAVGLLKAAYVRVGLPYKAP